MGTYFELISKNQGLNMNINIHSVNNYMLHLHSEMEILLVLKGSIKLILGDKNYELVENDFLLINSNEVHSTSKTKEDNICLSLQIDASLLNIFYPGFCKKKFKCMTFISDEEMKYNCYDKIRYYIANIIWSINKKDTGFEFDIWKQNLNIAKELLNNFCVGDISIEDVKDKEDNDLKIKKIISYIDERLDDGVTLEDVANKEEMNPYYLSHYIKKNIGISFQDYKNYRRLDKADNLLLFTNKTITEIALLSGFPSAKSFNSMFKKHYNQSPVEYRKSYATIGVNKDYINQNHDKIKSKSYLDVDRKEAFKKLFTYLNPSTSIETKDFKTIIETKQININQKRTPLFPYWKKLMTFGRAAEGLRQDWRNQLEEIQRDIGFEYVRFHGIFCDEMMVCNLDEENNIIYNWTYIDNLFDFFMEVNLKPFVELGFMPSELKSSDETMYWWKANMSQPKDINLWTELVKEFVKHCINRYGIREVESWYFEVWNEPEIQYVYWIGSKEEYFDFYKETAQAIKSISKNIKVGGPSIAHQALKDGLWLEEFINYCNENQAPLDLITLHIYPETYSIDENQILDMVGDVRSNGKDIDISQLTNLKSRLKNIYYDKDHTVDTINNAIDRINRISPKKLELHITEWSATALGRNLISDTCYTAAFIIKNIMDCINTVDSIGYWTFTDIMEELKAGISPFHGGFGLINKDGIKKPGYFAYYFLSKLGNEIISKEEDFIVTIMDENIQILVYNYTYFDELFLKGDTSALTYKERYSIFENKGNIEKQICLDGLSGKYKLTRYELNPYNGSAFDEWIKLGGTDNMTRDEIQYLKQRANPKMSVEYVQVEDLIKIDIMVPVHGLELILLDKIY